MMTVPVQQATSTGGQVTGEATEEDVRYRARARQALLGALTTWGLAGVVALLGYGSFAIDLVVFGLAQLALAAIYVIQYRV